MNPENFFIRISYAINIIIILLNNRLITMQYGPIFEK